MNKVFVYGTLMSGFGNNILLRDQNLIGLARTNPEFTMLHLGGFPGIVPGSAQVYGEVYEVTAKCLVQLDRLEGADLDNPEQGLYRRVRIELENGMKNVITYVFNGNENLSHYIVVEDGDWRDFMHTNARHY